MSAGFLARIMFGGVGRVVELDRVPDVALNRRVGVFQARLVGPDVFVDFYVTVAWSIHAATGLHEGIRAISLDWDAWLLRLHSASSRTQNGSKYSMKGWDHR
jgi:hypothetical protein